MYSMYVEIAGKLPLVNMIIIACMVLNLRHYVVEEHEWMSQRKSMYFQTLLEEKSNKTGKLKDMRGQAQCMRLSALCRFGLRKSPK